MPLWITSCDVKVNIVQRIGWRTLKIQGDPGKEIEFEISKQT